MIRLNKLVLEGFMSYRERQEVVFPRQGAILFSGRWLDRPISSGSGKSSLIHAVKFALGICDLPATTLKNWYSKKMFVSLTLSDDETGDLIEVIRDPKLQIIKNGQPYKGLSSGAEEQLTEILKANPELVAALTDRAQREKGFFTNSTDSEIKTFLSTLLNMSAIEAAGDQAAKALTDLTKDLENLDRDIQNQTNTVDLMKVSPEEEMSALESLSSTTARLNAFRDRESQIASVKAEIAELNGKVNDAKAAILENISAIKAAQSDSLKAIDAEITGIRDQITAKETENRNTVNGYQAQIRAARETIQEAISQRNALVSAEETRVKGLVAHHQAEIEAARKRIAAEAQEIQKQIDAIRKTENEVKTLLGDSDRVRTRLFELKSEIDKIKACTCYTCGQQWVTGDVVSRETEAKGLLARLQNNSSVIRNSAASIASLPQLQQDLLAVRASALDPSPAGRLAIAEIQAKPLCPELKKEIVELQKRALDPLPEVSETIKKLTSEIVAPELRASVSFLEAKRRVINPTQEAEIKALTLQMADPLPEAKARIQKLESGLATITSAKSDAEIAYRTAKALSDAVDKKIAAHQTEVLKLESKNNQRLALAQKLETEKHAAAILGRNGFMSAIFDEVLAEIQVNTNEMLAKLSNTSDITMELTSSKETKAGAIQKKTSLKFFKNGMSVPSIKGLSGGQQCGIELFADIAVAKCIRRRRGCHLGWMMLDEALDGLDTETKKEALGILKSQIDGQIFIIDHASEVREGFELTVQVVYNGRDSYVESAA